MQDILFEEQSYGVFLLITLALGGGAAWASGRAVAKGWKSRFQIFGYTILLGFGVRFLHFALFGGTLLSLHYYLIDTAILVAIGLLGYQYQLASQMTQQYKWLFVRTGPFSWRNKTSDAA